jgi:hypothetical protein
VGSCDDGDDCVRFEAIMVVSNKNSISEDSNFKGNAHLDLHKRRDIFEERRLHGAECNKGKISPLSD